MNDRSSTAILACWLVAVSAIGDGGQTDHLLDYHPRFALSFSTARSPYAVRDSD
jgi:hypothetical protein